MTNNKNQELLSHKFISLIVIISQYETVMSMNRINSQIINNEANFKKKIPA